MINRIPTRIELRLEDDLVDYEDTLVMRKNIRCRNIDEINSNIELTMSGNKLENEYVGNYSSPEGNLSNQQGINNNQVNITKQNIVSKFSHTDDSYNNSLAGDVSMK
jgi:hypothetical protein